MQSTGSVVPAAILLAAFVAVSCSGGSTTAPSSVASPSRTATPTPTPSPVPTGADLSQLVGSWKLDLRLTKIVTSSSGCVPDTMRSMIDVARPYALSISDRPVAVTLTDLSTDYRSLFTTVATDNTSFTTHSVQGYYSAGVLEFRCSDGTAHRLMSFGEDIAGSVSGTEIRGTWDAFFFELLDDAVQVEISAEFVGRR